MKNGFSPDYQLKLIQEGHYLLPWFDLPEPYKKSYNYDYYKNSIRKAAELKLPISFVSSQWEKYLTDSPYFYFMQAEINPNVVGSYGFIYKKVSPFGPVESWREMGKIWVKNPVIRLLQELYPDPPLVLFISNNEHKKLQWREVKQDTRYLSTYGTGRNDSFKRKIVGDNWIPRYRALQEGMRDGLTSDKWKTESFFVGYEAFQDANFCRTDKWLENSLYIHGRVSPWPLAWDGTSQSYYVNNGNSSTDFTVFSPQIESMSWVFMLNEARRINKKFMFELSLWDGHDVTSSNDKMKYYAKLGQTYNPARYEGCIQFGIWLLRPSIVREFRFWNETLSISEPYFMSVVRSVDRVHTNKVLRRFWRNGQLVANNKHQHPYQKKYTGRIQGDGSLVPAGYES